MSPSQASSRRIVASLLAVQVMFAGHYVAAKLLVEAVPPRLWAAVRIAGACALLYAMVRARGQRLPLNRSLLPRLALFSLLGVILNQVFFVEGLARTTPVNSALINCSIPVLTLLFAVFAGQERLSAPRTVGIVLALSGILVLLRVEALDLGNVLVQGNLLTLVNAASFSTFLVVSRPTLQKIPTLPATCLLFLIALVPVTLFSVPTWSDFHISAVTPTIWILAAFIIIFPTVLAYLLNYWALRRAPSSLVALFIYVQPLLTAALSVAIGGETITTRKVLAFILVTAGIFVALQDSGVPRSAG